MKTAALTACLTVAIQGALAQNDLLYHLAGDDTASWDWFGYSAAIDGDLLVVGNVGDSENGSASGSAHVFDLATGEQVAKLLPSYGNVGQWFGISCDISGNTAVVGAFSDFENGDRSGAAYLFNATTGVQLHKLVSDDIERGDYLGVSVAIEGSMAAVGSFGDSSERGAVYLFDVNTGTQLAKLTAPDASDEDQFGRFVAMDGGLIAVAAPYFDGSELFQGKIYVFDALTAQLEQTFVASDAAEGDRLGFGLAIDDGLVLAGAPYKDTRAGAAYVFDVASGAQLRKFVADDGGAQEYFGWSVALDGDRAVLGAFACPDNGSFAGAAYSFSVILNEQLAKILPDDGEAYDQFGHSVAASGGVAVIGANRDDHEGVESGSAYVYRLGDGCRADLNGDGAVDTQDFVAFLNAWVSQEPVGDWNGDGNWDIQDFIGFLGAWSAGCG